MTATASTPWGRKVEDILADGRWHVLDHVLRLAHDAVPPGVAYRRGERMRRDRGGPATRTLGGDHAAIASGARNKVYESIMSRIYRGTIERRDINGVAEIRRRPEAMAS